MTPSSISTQLKTYGFTFNNTDPSVNKADGTYYTNIAVANKAIVTGAWIKYNNNYTIPSGSALAVGGGTLGLIELNEPTGSINTAGHYRMTTGWLGIVLPPPSPTPQYASVFSCTDVNNELIYVQMAGYTTQVVSFTFVMTVMEIND
jgi:hypothetical protein